MYVESETLELKREVNNKIINEIIAFANTRGGTIYIGYEDNGEIVGVDNIASEIDRVSNIISDSIDPKLSYDIKIEAIKQLEKDIIVITVLKGTNRPYYIKSKGMTSEGVYIRLGATNKQASRDEIIKMMIEDTGVKFEDNVSLNQNITFNDFENIIQENNMKLDKVKMQNLGLINNSKYTNLAHILSDNSKYSMKVAIYKGNDKNEFLDKKEFENISVFKQLEEILKYINLIIKKPAKIVGTKRVEYFEYNIEVIRECLLNCITHRDYSVESSILINIFENKIEFVNLGGLIGGLTVDAIKKGNSATRNPKLTSIFHRLKYIESYGSGIPRIYSKYKKQNIKPTIEVSDNSFFISIPKVEFFNDNELDIILDYLGHNSYITREKVEELLNCSKTTAIRKLNEYVENSILKQVREGKNTYYQI